MERHPQHEHASKEPTIAILLRVVFNDTPWEDALGAAAKSPDTMREVLRTLGIRYQQYLETERVPMTHDALLTTWVIEAGEHDDYSSAVDNVLRVKSLNVIQNLNFSIVRKQLTQYTRALLDNFFPQEGTPEELLAVLSNAPSPLLLPEAARASTLKPSLSPRPFQPFTLQYVSSDWGNEEDEPPGESFTWPAGSFPALQAFKNSDLTPHYDEAMNLPDLQEALQARYEQIADWPLPESSALIEIAKADEVEVVPLDANREIVIAPDAVYWVPRIHMGKAALALASQDKGDAIGDQPQPHAVNDPGVEAALQLPQRLFSELTETARHEFAQELKLAYQQSPADKILRALLLFTNASEADIIAACQHLTGSDANIKQYTLRRSIGYCRYLFQRYEDYLLQEALPLISRPEGEQHIWRLKFLEAMLTGQRESFMQVLNQVPDSSREKAAETIRQAYLDMLTFTVISPPETFAPEAVTIIGKTQLARTDWRVLKTLTEEKRAA